MLSVAFPSALIIPTAAFSAETVVTSGNTVIVANQSDLGATTDTTTVEDGGTLAVTGDTNIQQSLYTLSGDGVSGAGALSSNGDNTVSGNIAIANTATITSEAGVLILDGDISSTNAYDLELTMGGGGDILYTGNLDVGAAGQSEAFFKTGTGTLTFTGTNNSFTGYSEVADGTLKVSDGGKVTITGASVNDGAFVNGNLIVTGAGSSFATENYDSSSLNYLVVGRDTTAPTSVTVDGGARLTTGASSVGEGIGYAQSSQITANVDGAGSVWDFGSGFTMGGAAGGTALLTISNGGVVTSTIGGQISIGRGGEGTATVTDAGSQLSTDWSLAVGELFNGNTGSGTLILENGGVAAAGQAHIGVGSAGTVTVRAGSDLQAGDFLGIGEASQDYTGTQATGQGDLTVEAGGLVAATNVWMGVDNGVISGSSGTLTVLGTTGSRGVLETQSLMKGNDSASALFDGGVLRATGNTAENAIGNPFIGSYLGTFNVDIGAGGMFVDTQDYSVTASAVLTDSDPAAPGALIKQGGGTLILTEGNTYTGNTTITAGTLQLGNGGTSGAILGDVDNAGELAFNRSNAYTFSGVVSGAGALSQIGTGTTILTGSSEYTGGTTITAGTLQLGDGGASGAILGDVDNAGELAFNRSNAYTFSGVVSGAGALSQIGTGTTILTGNSDYTGSTTIAAGTLQLGDGGTSGSILGDVDNAGELAFNRSNAYTFSGVVSGAGALSQIGTGTTILTGANLYSGNTTVTAGTLQAGAVDSFSAASNTFVRAGAHMNLAGFNQTVAGLDNAGLVATNGAEPDTVLTVTGNYTGHDGILALNTSLGGDNSATDLLHVEGSSSGSGLLRISNVGGTGAQTVEGIKVINIDGSSAATFALTNPDYIFEGDPAMVAGAYGYRLYKNGIATPDDGDWYLRSELLSPTNPGGLGNPPSDPLYQPGAPIYEVFANVLQGFNGLDTMQRRLGNRAWVTGAAEAGGPVGREDGSGIWARIVASHAEMDPKASTTDAEYDVDSWQLQAGGDGLLYSSDRGRLNGGVWVRYGTVSADVDSPYGAGSIAVTGYGLGGSLTWQGDGGFYLDGQGSLSWYDSDLLSDTAQTVLAKDLKGFGYAASLEAGKRIAVSPSWSLTPQAQLIYSKVDYDNFTDSFGSKVSLLNGQNLRGRLGIAADYENSWTDEAGETNRLYSYGIANLYYDFLSGSETDLAGVRFTNEADPLWGGIGIGGTYNWGNDKYALHAEAAVNTSLRNFGGSYDVTATLGLNVKF